MKLSPAHKLVLETKAKEEKEEKARSEGAALAAALGATFEKAIAAARATTPALPAPGFPPPPAAAPAAPASADAASPAASSIAPGPAKLTNVQKRWLEAEFNHTLSLTKESEEEVVEEIRLALTSGGRAATTYAKNFLTRYAAASTFPRTHLDRAKLLFSVATGQ